ncbi:MAG: alpha-amylase family glycosyl hydrolase, partial [Bacteroidota bacterium]
NWLIQNLTQKSLTSRGSVVKRNLHSLYMDHGDQTLDAFYPPHQRALDAELHPKNLLPGFRYQSRAFPGTAHSEKDWSARCLEAMAWVMKGPSAEVQTSKPAAPSAWRMYFALTDRMADGDSTNNHAVPGTYDPQRTHYHHGGDWEGLRQKIPYLKSIGINALWITPPVLNQSFNPDSSMTGYHGYWASDFRQPDPRWGSRRDFRRLAKDLDQNGIALIQDVVVNHTGDYFEVDSQGNLRFHNHVQPQQPLLQRAQSSRIYHRMPSIDDFRDSLQRLQGQMSGLDDLVTENPRLRRSLRRIYRRWVRWGRLRGMRMDTPLYVEEDFWRDFLHRKAWWDPGMHQTASRRGLDFWTFGEYWTHSEAWSDQGEERAAAFTKPGQGMEAALQFPLQKTMLEVLEGTRGTAHLTYRLEAQQKHFPNPLTRLQFLDNHDMPRIRSRLDSLGLAQALVLLYCLPGIPVLYSGTEFGTQETRYSMIHADPESGPYTPLIRKLNDFRDHNPSLQVSEPVVLVDSRLGSSAWVALVGGRWLLALNPGKQAVKIPYRDLLERLGPGWTLMPRPTLHGGGMARYDSLGWTLEPGETWVWGTLPPPAMLHAPQPLDLPFPLPANLDFWLDRARLLAEVKDQSYDDRGSNGNLAYPKAFVGNPGDLAGLRWLHSPTGGYILEIQMQGPLSRVWNPPHGMDHLHLTVDFTENVGNMTLNRASYTLNGWSATGDGPWEWYTRPDEGKVYAVFGSNPPLEPLRAVSTGEASTLRLLVRSWDVDGDGQPRSIRPNPGPYEFGGDPGAEAWMDQVELALPLVRY